MPDARDILDLRPPKKQLDPDLPYHFLHEQEVDDKGILREVNTIFLTNKECPFRCLMCDLWKHTLDQPTPRGAIPNQISHALQRLPEATVIKLYNNGNFFDTKAIPREDYRAIANLLESYDRVIVENHPSLCNQNCLEFRDMIQGTLEIAIGLETIHPEVLPKLNKQITTESYRRAAVFLCDNDINIRTFLLLNPPFLTDEEAGMAWTVKSAAFAFDHGAGACSIIPTRPGNGIMEKLQKEGKYVPPTLKALEEAFEHTLNLESGRVFADLWDLKKFSTCEYCFESRKTRMEKMNLSQMVLPPVSCNCH